MTDLILEYGINSFAAPISLTPDEVNLFSLVTNSPYFGKLPKPSPQPSNPSCDFLIIKNAFFDVSKKVPDVYRYDLVKINGEWKLVYPNTSILAQSGCYHHDISIDSNKNNILVILESPHRAEYCEINFKPLAPAMGETGSNFCTYFINHVLKRFINNSYSLESKLNKDKYGICFVNPVPFQTSLHYIHKNSSLPNTLRDKVWMQLFPLCLADFIARMNSYSSINPVIILNSCTGKSSETGTLKHTLKGEIDTAITNNQINCIDKINTPHPSSAHWKSTICTPW